MIYKEEIQNHVKSGVEYLELVGDILPHLHDHCKEKAVKSGIIDYWIDHCAREAENDTKV